MIRRIVGFLAGVYLLFAVIGRFVEEWAPSAAAVHPRAGASAQF